MVIGRGEGTRRTQEICTGDLDVMPEKFTRWYDHYYSTGVVNVMPVTNDDSSVDRGVIYVAYDELRDLERFALLNSWWRR